VRSVYQLTQGPASEPVTVADVLTYLRQDHAEAIPDIESRIARAREYVEEQTGRSIVTQSWKLFRDQWPHCHDRYPRTIFLERSPVVSVESVKYYPADGSPQVELDTSVYGEFLAAQPGQIYLVSSQQWPQVACRPDAIEISFTAGIDDVDTVPEKVKNAVLLKIKEGYDSEFSDADQRALRTLIEMNRIGGFVA
jgi:uncharacterized phiE125 gp8 family phage protein